MTSTTTVRPLTAADFDAWLPLWQGYLEFYETELSEDITRHTFDRLVDSTTEMYCALAIHTDGSAVGMVT
jgi:hypothetical protein